MGTCTEQKSESEHAVNIWKPTDNPYAHKTTRCKQHIFHVFWKTEYFPNGVLIKVLALSNFFSYQSALPLALASLNLGCICIPKTLYYSLILNILLLYTQLLSEYVSPKVFLLSRRFSFFITFFWNFNWKFS